MSEWKEIKLEDVTIKVTDGSHYSPQEYTKGKPMFSVKDMNEYGFQYDGVKTISEDEFNKLVKAGCQPEIDDVLIAKDGSVLKHIFRVKQQPDYVLLSSIAIIRPNKELIIPDFLAYTIKEPSTRDLILNNFVGGSGVPRIVLKDFKQIEINLPPLPEQQAIAEVLSSLDDKIDLLHRQNQTLEQMAETLFRQWFVEEARENWEEKPLSSIADFLNGLACQKYPPKNEVEKLPVLKIKELRNGFSDDCDWATTEVKSEYIVKNGDVIFSWSASLMVKIWDGETCILNQHLFKVTSDEFPKWYYYLWSKHHLNEFISISASHATTMGHIKRGDLDNAIVLIPSPEELKKFSEILNPIIDKIIANNKQLTKLVEMRDTLLPKLMSGEVRIKS